MNFQNFLKQIKQKSSLVKATLAIIFIACIAFLYTCERDDICASATPTTPQLIIRFYDIDNKDALKSVNDLTVIGDGVDYPIYDLKDTDSIAIPLKFAEEGVLTTTKLYLTKDAGTEPNTDTLQVSYTPEFVYVSRACGYKSVFNNIQVSILAENEKWIFSTETILSNIENETEAHVYLFH